MWGEIRRGGRRFGGNEWHSTTTRLKGGAGKSVCFRADRRREPTYGEIKKNAKRSSVRLGKEEGTFQKRRVTLLRSGRSIIGVCGWK